MGNAARARALQQLAQRQANAPDKIDNANAQAGDPMTFYCRVCGHVSDVLPETYVDPPARYCRPCQELVDANVIE